MAETAKYVVVPVEMTPAKLEAMAFNMSAEFGPEFVKPLGAFAKALYREITSGAPAARPAAPSREAVAEAIYKTSERWIAPNFRPGWTLAPFGEASDRDRRLHLDYADAILALFAAQPGEAGLYFANGERITRKDLNNAYRQGSESGWLAASVIPTLTTQPTAALLEKAEKALDDIISDWDARGLGRQETFINAVDGEDDSKVYWSPMARMLGSEHIAAARSALTDIRKARS